MLPGGNVKIYLAVGATDMRKAIDGLAIMVSQSLDFDPLSGHLFAFSNRRRNMVKVLYWDRNGFCLWQKRLEKGTIWGTIWGQAHNTSPVGDHLGTGT